MGGNGSTLGAAVGRCVEIISTDPAGRPFSFEWALGTRPVFERFLFNENKYGAVPGKTRTTA